MKLTIAGFIAVTLWATAASAHSLNLFVRDEGTTVKGNAYFTGGTPAQNIAVRAEDTSGKLIGETTTDAEGNFVYTGPRAAGTTMFVASTPDGHRATAGIESGSSESALPNAPVQLSNDSSMISHEAQLTKLHEAIDRLEKRLWLRDLIGGIGYIFGLAGLWALIKARSGSNGH